MVGLGSPWRTVGRWRSALALDALWRNAEHWPNSTRAAQPAAARRAAAGMHTDDDFPQRFTAADATQPPIQISRRRNSAVVAARGLAHPARHSERGPCQPSRCPSGRPRHARGLSILVAILSRLVNPAVTHVAGRCARLAHPVRHSAGACPTQPLPKLRAGCQACLSRSPLSRADPAAARVAGPAC